MASEGDDHLDYPDRANLVNSMCQLLKTARTPLTGKWRGYGLVEKGWHQLDRLTHILSGHLYFEHCERKAIRLQLLSDLNRYRALRERGEVLNSKQFATEVLDALAKPPTHWLVYFGVHHLELAGEIAIGDVRFVHIDEEEGLAGAFGFFGWEVPKLLCSVPVVAGNEKLALLRARRSADMALALIRQKVLYGFAAKVYLDQVAFGLDGTYAWRVEREYFSGWWPVQEHPLEMDLSAQNDWTESLKKLSECREVCCPEIRNRVDTALEWLDIAAHTENWRITLTTVFSAMEALLVPENSGTKAAAVTVRSVAVHAALDKRFFHPIEAYNAYLSRNYLVHGGVTLDMNEIDLTALAEDRKTWAFRVFSDYLLLVATSGFKDLREMISYLDTQFGDKVCDWLTENGMKKIVDEYQRMLNV